MPGLLFGRVVRVAVANLQIEKLRIQVEIDRPADGTQSTGHVTIHNLSAERESQVYERAETIRVDAGYPSTVATIFSGRVQRVVRARQVDNKGVHRLLKIALGDETRASGRLGGMTARAYAGQERVAAIVTDFAADMGLAARTAGVDPQLTVTDWSASGKIVDALGDLLGPFQLGWYEQDGVIVVTPIGTTNGTPTDPPKPLSAETGLEGVPEITDEGATATMLLNPAVERGTHLLIESTIAAGLWRVAALKHTADNRGGKFHTRVELRAVA